MFYDTIIVKLIFEEWQIYPWIMKLKKRKKSMRTVIWDNNSLRIDKYNIFNSRLEEWIYFKLLNFRIHDTFDSTFRISAVKISKIVTWRPHIDDYQIPNQLINQRVQGLGPSHRARYLSKRSVSPFNDHVDLDFAEVEFGSPPASISSERSGE